MKTKVEMIKDEVGVENYKIYEKIKDFSKLKGIQARMPFVINIK